MRITLYLQQICLFLSIDETHIIILVHTQQTKFVAGQGLGIYLRRGRKIVVT